MGLTISIRELHDILKFANPGGKKDADEMDTEVTIKYCEARASTDGDAMPAGHYVWLAEYPEEGCYGPLGELGEVEETSLIMGPCADKPLLGDWRHGNGFVCCGSVRIFRADIDTNPCEQYTKELLDWVCETLNNG